MLGVQLADVSTRCSSHPQGRRQVVHRALSCPQKESSLFLYKLTLLVVVPSHAYHASSLRGLLDLNEKVHDFKF